MRHETHVVENSVNRAEQMIVEEMDETGAEKMPLKAGEFSLHHGMAIHRSAPNQAGHRRIGLGLNFMPTHTKPAGSIPTAAMLVRGEDKYGYFELVTPPKAELDEKSIATHKRAVTAYRDNYLEFEALHRQGAV
jgi:non-haem Fe2+, alpha-ketoglutarate-dependent halogenase